jgi:hypothetical protein
LLLHRNWRGDTGNGVLTGGELGTMENGSVDEGNQCKNREELRGSVLQLQRKKEHMRRRPDQATNDKRCGGELSPVDGGNQCKNREELRGSVLQLQRKKEHMRRRPDQATNDERRGGELSPVDGRWQWHDPRWRPEEWSPSCKNRGKRSMRSRRNSMHEESMNGGRSRRLADNEHDGGLPHDGGGEWE